MGIKAFDWKLDENGDYDFSSGDFEIVESSLIHLENLIGSVTADYKFAPQFGVNLNSFLNSSLGLIFTAMILAPPLWTSAALPRMWEAHPPISVWLGIGWA